MKNSKLLIFTFLLNSILGFSQIQRQNGLSITIKGPNTEIEGVSTVDKTAKTQHIRFLSEEFSKAKVDDLKDTFFFRYNIFADEMEFMRDETIYFLSKTENQIINFIDSNRKYTVKNIDGKLEYVEINYSGNNTLYTKQHVAFIEGKVAKTQFETSKEAKFIRKKDTYFISTKDGEIIELPRGKKDFYSLFGEKSNAVKKFMKKEKLNRKKIEDVTKAIKYFDTL